MQKQTIGKRIFSPKRMAIMAMFVALSYIVSLLEFAVFPATPYLKIDFGNVFILLVGFLFGPIEGIIVCVLKELLCLIGTSSGGAGQVANMLMTVAYIIVPCAVYRKRKGFGTVIATLVAACIIGTVTALIVNRFIVFPLYMGDGAKDVFNGVVGYVAAFNAVKTVSISVLSLLLYKRLSWFIKKYDI